MNNLPKEISKHLPLTEATCYILIALAQPLHGYAVMQKVEELSQGQVTLGPGTLYGAFSTLEKDGLIVKVGEEERRKSYTLTPKGRQVLAAHIQRSETLVQNGKTVIGGW